MDEALEEFSRVAEKEAEEIESPAHGQEANRYEYSTVELTRWRGRLRATRYHRFQT